MRPLLALKAAKHPSTFARSDWRNGGGIAYNLLAEGEKFLVLSNFGFGGNMKIPEVANRIREIDEQVQGVCPDEANELLELADQLRRRPLAAPRAPATSTPMTDVSSGLILA